MVAAPTASSAYPRDPTLVHYPHPALRQRAVEVADFDDPLRAFCRAMFGVMDAEKGVGLAAPQVAVSRRIFVTDHAKRKGDPDASDRRIFINPRLEDCQGETVHEEGCLSFPGIYAKVKRHDRFTLRYQDEHGREHALRLDVAGGDFLGIVVQHELDHLDGVVFLDHLAPAQFEMVRRRVRDLEDGWRKAGGGKGAVLRR